MLPHRITEVEEGLGTTIPIDSHEERTGRVLENESTLNQTPSLKTGKQSFKDSTEKAEEMAQQVKVLPMRL